MTRHIYTSTLGIPDGHVIKEMFGVRFYVHRIETSNKGMIRNIIDRDRNEYQEGFDLFINSLPEEANAVIGMQITTSTQTFSNFGYMNLVFSGTAVQLSEYQD